MLLPVKLCYYKQHCKKGGENEPSHHGAFPWPWGWGAREKRPGDEVGKVVFQLAMVSNFVRIWVVI